MSSRPTSPVTTEAMGDLFRRALDAGIAQCEIEALIVRARALQDAAACPECGATLVPLGDVTLRCTACGIRTSGTPGGLR